jgi:hypothetical protein
VLSCCFHSSLFYAALSGFSANAKTFQMTKEALAAIKDIIEFLKTRTSVYNVDLSAPIYLMTDASQVASGAFLYQVDVYDRTPENEELPRFFAGNA